jgi:hypothetical protein
MVLRHRVEFTFYLFIVITIVAQQGVYLLNRGQAYLVELSVAIIELKMEYNNIRYYK